MEEKYNMPMKDQTDVGELMSILRAAGCGDKIISGKQRQVLEVLYT